MSYWPQWQLRDQRGLKKILCPLAWLPMFPKILIHYVATTGHNWTESAIFRRLLPILVKGKVELSKPVIVLSIMGRWNGAEVNKSEEWQSSKDVH